MNICGSHSAKPLGMSIGNLPLDVMNRDEAKKVGYNPSFMTKVALPDCAGFVWPVCVLHARSRGFEGAEEGSLFCAVQA
jgi:hypothetical protein